MSGPPSARRDWPVGVHPLGAEPGDDLRATTSAEERLAMMWALALEGWELSGRDVPAYARSETPVSLRPAAAAVPSRRGE